MKQLLLYISLLSLVACGNSFELKEEQEDFTSGDFPLTNLNFETINREIMQKSCVKCHKAYGNYDAVFQDRQKIRNSILQNRMPKNAPALSDELKTMIATWVGIGAPRGGTNGNEPPKELEPTWESLSIKLFFPKCVQCHNPGGQASFLDISTRQKFWEQRVELLNNFEDVENSYLFEVINDPDEPMPPAFSGIGILSENEKAIIKEWIEKGLP
jgi:hypothetical protein